MNASNTELAAQTPGNGDLQGAIQLLTPRTHVLNALQLIIDSHSIVSVTDYDGCLIYVNDHFCELSQYSRDELIGQHRAILRSDYHPNSFFEELWSTVRSGRVWTGDIQNRAKDGALFWLQSTISPIFNEENRIVGFAGVQTDVTSQRQMLAELQDSEQRAYAILQTAIDAIDSAISIVDQSGKIVVSNKAQAQMYPELLEVKRAGKHVSDVVRMRNPHFSEAEVQAQIDNVMTRDTMEQRQLADGREVKVQRKIIPGGGFVSLHTDITDIVLKSGLLERQAATMDLMMAIAVDANESADAESAYARCLKRICEFTGWEMGHIYLPSEDGSEQLKPSCTWYGADIERFSPFKEMTEETIFETGQGLPGQVMEGGAPVWVQNVTAISNFPRRQAAKQSGIVGGAAFPVKIRDEVVAVLEFYSTRLIEPSTQLAEVLSHVCTQVGRVAERDRSEKNLMTRVAAELRKRDRELVEQNELFDAALENMSQGLCMFDADQKLIVCNERYSALYGLTSELVKPGTTLSEIVQHRIANGLYAGPTPDDYIEERQKWALTKEIERKVHVLNDGRSIAVSKRPLSGGGWVSTHEDITERMQSERALQESQELLSKAFRASPAAMTVSNPEDGSHLDVNESWTNMLGYSHEEAMQSSALQLGIWADPKDREHFVDQISADGAVNGLETSFRTKDGKKLDVLVSGEYVEVGGKPRLLVVSYDITERKRAEQALRESENRFKTLVESTNVVPWEFDPKIMRFTYVGPQAVALFGYPVEDWYKENFWTDIIHPDDREQAVRICMEATRACKDHDFEYRIVTADGGEVWVRDVVSVIVEGGKTKSLRGILFDISERKKASEALQRSEQRFKNIVEVSSDWIWECNEELRFTFLSERFSEVTGVPMDNVIGKTRHEFANGVEAEWAQHLSDLAARRPFRDFRYTIETAEGPRHWSISGRPVFDSKGNFTGYCGTGSDLTAEVEAEAELIRHRDHLQELVNEATGELKQRAEELKLALAKEKELNELQRQFVSMASHEFRTPLAIIDSAAQRLQRRVDHPDPKDTLKRAEKIRSAVARMAQLMESTLSAARLEAGSPTIQISACDISSMLREICDRQQEIAQRHDISCMIGDLPDTIQADASAIEQIFTNLLSNAVKYAPETPEIEVSACRDGGNVLVAVRDHGVGIDEDDMPSMFQRFFRAKTSAGIAGTGIGLNLVKTLVELHDGVITVESEKGKGSLFTVQLPIDGPEVAQETGEEAA